MVSKQFLLFAAFIGFAAATPIDSMLDDMRVNCDNGVDPLACGKFNVMSVLDTVFKSDNYQVRFLLQNDLYCLIRIFDRSPESKYNRMDTATQTQADLPEIS